MPEAASDGARRALLHVLPGDACRSRAYPVRPLRVVTGGTGSNSDFVTLIVAQALTGALNQQVIVDNRPSGARVGEMVAHPSPDGYALLVSGSSFWLAPFLTPKLSWHPLKEFTPVILLTSSPNLIVVTAGSSIQSVPDLIAQAKARPGRDRLRLGRDGFDAASRGRAVQSHDGRERDAHQLQGERERDQRRDGRPRAVDVPVGELGHRSREGGPLARARRDQCAAVGARAGTADRGRERRSGLQSTFR